ncbi:MAG TPA: hypothetical protein VE978_05565, partial [Chitinophagales bacterium]|nr:hypothetical protein [Chitinophagales bacterium]
MPIGQRYINFFAPAVPQMISHPTDKTKVNSFGRKVSAGKFHWVLVIAILFWLPSLGQTTLVDPAGNGGFELGTTFALNGWTVANG